MAHLSPIIDPSLILALTCANTGPL